MCKKAILGKKIGMTQIFSENGDLVPVTVIEAGPCYVVQKKTVEIDGYQAIQIGFYDKKEKHVTKPLKGHFNKAGVGFKRFLKEIRFENQEEFNIGDEINVSQFADVEFVDVTGTSKGKGFAGSIKRWGHHRGPMSHGSGYHRWAGSMGACSDPSRVFKGKKLPGHLGDEKVTVQNISVARVDADRNILLLKGSVPGPKNGLLIIKNSIKLI